MLTRPENGRPIDLSRILRPVTQASFALLDSKPVLFSEPAQKIYELNEMAAYIWCSLSDQKPTETICEELTKFGLNRFKARTYVHQALRSWLRLGLLEVDWRLSENHSFTTLLGKLTVSIRTSSEELMQLLMPLFAEGNSRADQVKDALEVVEIDHEVYIFHNKSCVARCAINELVPTVKAQITEQIVLNSSPDIALHAACLMSRGKSLLVSGRPGIGKTTLAIHLMEAGFEYGADDVVLIAPNGRATGIPFAPTVKTGAWAMVAKLRPDLNDSLVHTRPDGKLVRYLRTPGPARSDVPVGWIVFIERAANVPAKLSPLGQLETLRRVMDGSYSLGGKLTRQAFCAIRRTLADAQSYELQYSDAFQARDLIVGLCND